MSDRAQSMGRLLAYGEMSAAVESLARTEMARGMPNGTGYAQALQDVVDRLRSMVDAELAKPV